MSATIIKMCRCVHPFQDKIYGQKQRVHNQAGSTGKNKDTCVCTVCGDRKPINSFMPALKR